jgi:hypothetical protein
MQSVPRPFWLQRLAAAWRKAPIVWLSGVRRVGKTTLARQLDGALYLNCDLPSTADRLADPERCFAAVQSPIVVLDEVHRLPDPSRVLKIAADEFPQLKLLATGSSTLAATEKFRDSLTGRKRSVHLLPVLASELQAFGIQDLAVRLRRGGLPAALLSPDLDAELYGEWLDSFYARDIQELFRVEKRRAFLALVRLLLRQSGSLLEVTSLARATELSRPTVMTYLDVLETTHAITVLRPFHDGGRQELVRQPKAYGFDTGFACHARGWSDLRPEDCGLLWEHLVLESLLTHLGPNAVYFWRDKQQHEVDFVVRDGARAQHAIECKWSRSAFDPRGLAAFRREHPAGRNWVVLPARSPTTHRSCGDLEVTFLGLEALLGEIG